VLLLDEPTSALDTQHQALVLSVVAEHVAKGRHATILVTHDVLEAMRLGNRLLVLGARGDVQAFLSPSEKSALDEGRLRDLLIRAASLTWTSSA
jgi:ABC-type nitrate/sulfonate/bicarbonate transport system ATPase subunit